MQARIIILATVLLVVCSPERRLQRLLSRHPELHRTDTITVVVPADTVMVRDTLTQHDTITITNDRQTVQIVRVPTGSPCDTAKVVLDVTGTVKADTVTVTVDRVVPCPTNTKVSRWWRTAAMVMAVLCLAMFLLYRYPPNRDHA